MDAASAAVLRGLQAQLQELRCQVGAQESAAAAGAAPYQEADSFLSASSRPDAGAAAQAGPAPPQQAWGGGPEAAPSSLSFASSLHPPPPRRPRPRHQQRSSQRQPGLQSSPPRGATRRGLAACADWLSGVMERAKLGVAGPTTVSALGRDPRGEAWAALPVGLGPQAGAGGLTTSWPLGGGNGHQLHSIPPPPPPPPPTRDPEVARAFAELADRVQRHATEVCREREAGLRALQEATTRVQEQGQQARRDAVALARRAARAAREESSDQVRAALRRCERLEKALEEAHATAREQAAQEEAALRRQVDALRHELERTRAEAVEEREYAVRQARNKVEGEYNDKVNDLEFQASSTCKTLQTL